MAIEDFGRSLLSQVHEQRRRQRKKRESYSDQINLIRVQMFAGEQVLHPTLSVFADLEK